MKDPYIPPKLTRYGTVSQITQVLGPATRQDFFFNSAGDDIGGNNDIGSRDFTDKFQ
ncbi:MAG: lasso peptide [Cyanobacteria bacterium J06649_11]